MTLVPRNNPVEIRIDETVPDGEIYRPEHQDGEPFRFFVSSRTALLCWEDLRRMKEQMEFIVSLGEPVYRKLGAPHETGL